jgi:hypothetical protein
LANSGRKLTNKMEAASETLTLRANTPPRRALPARWGIGGAAVSSLAIAGVAWMALGPKPLHIAAAGEDKAVTDCNTPADQVRRRCHDTPSRDRPVQAVEAGRMGERNPDPHHSAQNPTGTQ